MQELEIKVVEPYTVEHFEDQEFKHHYVWRGNTYKAGDFFLNHGELDEDKYPDLKQLWLDFDYFVNHDFPRLQQEFKALDDEMEAFRLKHRGQTDKMLDSIYKSTHNPKPYYQLKHAKVWEMRFNWERQRLAHELELMQVLQFGIVCEIHKMMGTNLPINLAEMQDSTGHKTAFAYIWHCPQNPDGSGDAKEYCNPDSMRDFRQQLAQIVTAKRGKEGWYKLVKKYPDALTKVVKAYDEQGQEQPNQSPKLILPGS